MPCSLSSLLSHITPRPFTASLVPILHGKRGALLCHLSFFKFQRSLNKNFQPDMCHSRMQPLRKACVPCRNLEATVLMRALPSEAGLPCASPFSVVPVQRWPHRTTSKDDVPFSLCSSTTVTTVAPFALPVSWSVGSGEQFWACGGYIC